jgi:hypothetical protein
MTLSSLFGISFWSDAQVSGGLQHVFVNGHDKRLCLDARERFFEIAAARSADVVGLRLSDHAKQVIGVHGKKIIL